MIDNERRADLGQNAIQAAADDTGVWDGDYAETAVTDVLAYIGHFCDRLGIDVRETFEHGIRSYRGDFEDGPRAMVTLDPERPLSDQVG
jgi:hypothetical protein